MGEVNGGSTSNGKTALGIRLRSVVHMRCGTHYRSRSTTWKSCPLSTRATGHRALLKSAGERCPRPC